MRSKEIARKLAAIKGIEVRGHGAGWVQIASATSFVIKDETTPLCEQVESLLPDGWEIDLSSKLNSYRICKTNMEIAAYSFRTAWS